MCKVVVDGVKLDEAGKLVTKIMLYQSKLNQFKRAEGVSEYPIPLDRINGEDIWVLIGTNEIIKSMEQSIESLKKELADNYDMVLSGD